MLLENYVIENVEKQWIKENIVLLFKILCSYETKT